MNPMNIPIPFDIRPQLQNKSSYKKILRLPDSMKKDWDLHMPNQYVKRFIGTLFWPLNLAHLATSWQDASSPPPMTTGGEPDLVKNMHNSSKARKGRCQQDPNWPTAVLQPPRTASTASSSMMLLVQGWPLTPRMFQGEWCTCSEVLKLWGTAS
jgi:hypothetical protein